MDFKRTDITDSIIRGFYTVYNTLGYGFLERVLRGRPIAQLWPQT